MLKIEILEDVEAMEKEGLNLLMVKIESNKHVHYEYGFVDEMEAVSWIDSLDLTQ